MIRNLIMIIHFTRKSFVGSKIMLRMSRLSYGLLSVFLNQNNLLFLAKVINEKLDITIAEETVGDDIIQTKVANDGKFRVPHHVCVYIIFHLANYLYFI
jgi:hypothetical protein